MSAKIVEKALVLLGCPRKVLFLHWFYKVVREKYCFYIGFTRLSTKSVVFTLVLQGCPRKMLFYIGFTRLSAENVGFTRLSASCPRQMLKTHVFVIGFRLNVSADNRGQPARFWTEEGRRHDCLQTALAPEWKRLSLAHTASPRLARSHARTKRNDFPVAVSQRTHRVRL